MSPGTVRVGPEWIDEEDAKYLQYFGEVEYFECPSEEVRFIDGKMLCGDILCEGYRERLTDSGEKVYECGCRVIEIGYDCEYVPGWWEDYCHKRVKVRDCAFAELECNGGECRIKRVKRRPPGGCICTGTCNCGVVG